MDLLLLSVLPAPQLLSTIPSYTFCTVYSFSIYICQIPLISSGCTTIKLSHPLNISHLSHYTCPALFALLGVWHLAYYSKGANVTNKYVTYFKIIWMNSGLIKNFNLIFVLTIPELEAMNSFIYV